MGRQGKRRNALSLLPKWFFSWIFQILTATFLLLFFSNVWGRSSITLYCLFLCCLRCITFWLLFLGRLRYIPAVPHENLWRNDAHLGNSCHHNTTNNECDAQRRSDCLGLFTSARNDIVLGMAKTPKKQAVSVNYTECSDHHWDEQPCILLIRMFFFVTSHLLMMSSLYGCQDRKESLMVHQQAQGDFHNTLLDTRWGQPEWWAALTRMPP